MSSHGGDRSEKPNARSALSFRALHGMTVRRSAGLAWQLGSDRSCSSCPLRFRKREVRKHVV